MIQSWWENRWAAPLKESIITQINRNPHLDLRQAADWTCDQNAGNLQQKRDMGWYQYWSELMVRRYLYNLYRLNHEFHEYHVLAKKSGLSAAYSSVSCWWAARSCSIAGDRNYCTPVTRRPFRSCSSYSGEVRPTPTQLHGDAKFSQTTSLEQPTIKTSFCYRPIETLDGRRQATPMVQTLWGFQPRSALVFLLSLAVMQTGSSHGIPAFILGLEAPAAFGGVKHPGCPNAAKTYLPG